MMGRRVFWVVVVVAAALLVIFVRRPGSEPVMTHNNPGLTREHPDVILQGIVKDDLPAEDISADYLWGAGKFAVFEVYAPADRDLLISEITAQRLGGTDTILPTVWLRMNRERVYSETPLVNGKLDITSFPVPNAPADATDDTHVDGATHRVMKQPASTYLVPAGESATVEFFGNFGAGEPSRNTPVSFCLEKVVGTLVAPDGTTQTAESSLNRTCWNTMTIVPAERSD